MAPLRPHYVNECTKERDDTIIFLQTRTQRLLSDFCEFAHNLVTNANETLALVLKCTLYLCENAKVSTMLPP